MYPTEISAIMAVTLLLNSIARIIPAASMRFPVIYAFLLDKNFVTKGTLLAPTKARILTIPKNGAAPLISCTTYLKK